MDYERIETISKNLSHERINIRLRTATNLLQKLGDGIIDKDAFSNSACLTTLLSGVHKAIAQILENANDLADHNKESNELLQALMAILQATVKDPTRSNCVNISTKILEQLYFLKETENIDGTVKKSLDDAIGILCGMDRSARTTHAAHVELDLRTAHLAGATYTSSQQLSTEPPQANSKFRGAGAILNSRLVHTGWKFSAFVLTERDERWLLDVQIKVKLQNDRAARDLWDVLEDFPPQAVLLNTHLLHGVLDLVGSPFSQADVDADPQGLHALSALKWLETLLQKCTHAFAVQLDGSLCTHSPYSSNDNQQQGDGDIMPDLAGKLAKAMYALRHPSLPTTSTSTTTSNTTSSSLYPGPSVPGLAFACCAASLPLLQSRDTTVGRAVCSLLRVALPLVLEPRLLLSSHGQKEGGAEEVLLMEVEHGRLQHLLNRMEQLLAFFGDTFDIDAFLTLIDEEDDNNNSTSNTSLQGHCFDLTFLSCVLTLFRAVPPSSLLASSELDDGRQGKLRVGPLATQCLLKIATTSPALEALLPGCATVVQDTLSVINGAALGNIEAARRIFTTARIFTGHIDRTLLPGAVLEYFTHAAQACVSLLDGSCTVAVPALQQTIAAALPILLQSAYERLDIDETEAERALELLCALVVRVLSCGAPAAKSILLTHLHAWLTRSYELLPSPGAVTPCNLFSEQQVQLIKQLNLDASSGRQVASVLATPSVVQALLHCTTTATTDITATEDSEVNGGVSLQAQQVLEVLCAYSLQYHSSDFNHSSSTTSNSHNEGVHPWSHLLLPLKLAEWEAEHLHGNSNTHLDASFTDTSNNHSPTSSYAALTGFARRLQETCADSASVPLKTVFARSLVVGLFHTDSAVRINSALRVRRDLLHVPLPTGLNDNSDNSGNNGSEGLYSVLAYDLFPAGGVLKLGPWQSNTPTTTTNFKTKANTMRVPNNSTFTHANVRKVAAIGFSEVDASTRATALAQVVDLLKSDVHLLHTVDMEWAYATVKSALSQLASLAPFVDSAEQNTLQYDAAALTNMPDAECRLFLQTMRVVGFFLTYFAVLRTRVYFHAEKSTGGDNYNAHSGVLNVSVLLRLLLGTHSLQTKKSNNSSSTRITTTTINSSSNSNSAGYEVLQQVAVECAQILSILTCTADSWAPFTTTHHTSDTDTMATVATAVGVKYEYTHDRAVGTPSVAIPAHLVSRFLFPSSLSSSKNEYTMKYSDTSNTAPKGKIAAAVLTIGNNNRGNNSSSGSGGGNMTTSEAASSVAFAMVQLVCQPVEPVVYPPEDILKLLVNSTHAPTADRIKTLTATKLFSFVIHASNHTSLREGLSCTLALCQADPLLLHVFVALRISLVTAVSHIVTVTPRTHKDHVTLSSVLDFLSTAFASLQRTTSNNTAAVVVVSPGFLVEVAEWFAEALSAVLPLMSQYLADHFHHATAHSSSHSASALTESAKEHSVAAHTACTSYFRLLSVLTAFVHPKYALSSVLSGHYVLSLLVHLASSELHGACDRAVALRILENVVRLQEGGWQALCCIESPAYTTLSGRSPKPNLSPTNYKSTYNVSPGGKSRNLAAFAAEAEQFNVVDTLVRMLRLVRTPDSLQSHAAVVGALRLMLVALQRQRCDTNVSSAKYSLAESERDWKWLIRLIYDRRSEVKVLAVEILALVLDRITTLKNGDTEVCDRSVDSLNGADEAEKKVEKEEKEEELVQWPPFELLTHLCSDSTESTALRLRALHVLVTARLDLPALYSAVQKHFKLPVVLGALHECLSVREGDCAVTSSIHAALQLLTRLVTHRDETLVQDMLTLCGTMKVTPLLVEVLNVRLQSSLHLRALRRVSVWEEEYISRAHTTYFQHDSLACSLRDNKDSSGYFLLGSGWRSLQLSHLGKDAEAVKDIRTLACWFFFHLRAADPGIFMECVQRSTLLHHLVTSFSAVSADSSPSSSSLAPVFECGSVTAQAELLSMLISLESSASSASSAGALQSYVMQNEAVPGNVLKKIILILLSVMDFEVSDIAVRQQQLQLQCVSACLRLLTGMLDEPHWRSRLGLGVSATGGPGSVSMSTACAYLFDLLLSMRRVISTLTLSTSTTSSNGCEANCAGAEVVVQRIDFTVALFMQHSAEARGLFVQQSVHTQLAIVETGRATSNSSDMCVFQQHVTTLVSAVTILHSPAAVTTSSGNNTTAQGSGGKGVMSLEAKRSLQGIKARTSAATATVNATASGVSVSTGASTVKRGAGSIYNINKQNTSHPAVGQSTSTWATSRTSVTSTTNSSKWRDKSRSYQWNKDKQDASATLNGPHRPTTTAAGGTGSQELPDKVKRQLWAALTVLSQVMPGCPTAVDWAIDLQLHQSLSKLLRFAARYSISTLVTSSTSSTATSYLHQLDGLLHNNNTTEMMADSCWVPSNGMLAAGIYSLCCAFTYQHAHAKQCFLSTGEAAAAVLHTNNNNSTIAGNTVNSSTGTALHQLITLGVTRSMAPVSRWLSLGLAGSLLSGAKNTGSSAMKSTFSQMVALTLQRSLHSAYSDPEAVVPLLTTLTSFLTTEEDLAYLTQLCRKDSAGLLKHLHVSDNHLFGGGGDKNGGKDAMVEDFKRVTFPELLSWVAHSTSTSTSKDTTSEGRSCVVAVAVSRVLGRISLVDSKAHRTVGNLLCEDTLGLLCANYTSSHPLVSNVSALALWHIVHHSEKGKHLVRDLLSRHPHNTSTTTVGEKENVNYDRNNDVDENEEDEEGLWEVEGVQKARFVIDSLRSAT